MLMYYSILNFDIISPYQYFNYVFRSEYLLKFDDKFEIHDDIEVLKRMGLLLGNNFFYIFLIYLGFIFFLFTGLDKGECAYEDIERAKTMVPKSFEKYIESRND